MDQMTERNRRLAREGEPVFSLAGILAQKTEAERAELVRLAGTEDLAAWLLEPEHFTMLLDALPAADFDLFSKAAEAPFLQEDQVFLPMHGGLIHFALMPSMLQARMSSGAKMPLPMPTYVAPPSKKDW